jgi:hypothetical protein
MSTTVPMPVRIDPPPAEIGEIPHGARLARCARPRGFRLGPRRVQRRGARELELGEFLLAPVFALGIGARGFRLGLLGARRGDLCPAQLDLHAGFRVVERRKDVAGGDALSFLDAHLAHLAGDLRRDRRLPPGGHVAGRIEHGRTTLRRGHRARDGDAHLDWLVAADDPGDEDGDRHGRAAEGDPQAQAGRRSVPCRVAVDAQFLEQLGLVQAFWIARAPGPRSLPQTRGWSPP